MKDVCEHDLKCEQCAKLQERRKFHKINPQKNSCCFLVQTNDETNKLTQTMIKKTGTFLPFKCLFMT